MQRPGEAQGDNQEESWEITPGKRNKRGRVAKKCVGRSGVEEPREK